MLTFLAATRLFKMWAMIQIYQYLFRKIWPVSFILIAIFCFNSIVKAQVLSTAGGTNYTNTSFVPAGTPGVVTFVIQNTNAQFGIIKKIDHFARQDQPNNTYKLWYSATPLSGPTTVGSSNWVLVATGNPISVASDAVTTVLDNLSIIIPANTQYRFALQTTNGIGYTGSNTPSPNSFSSGGFTLKVGNHQIAGQNVGYGGSSPSPAATPGFFSGAVYLTLCASSAIAATPVITADTAVCGAGNPVTLNIISGNLNQADKWNWFTGSCGGTLIGSGTSITVSPAATTSYYVRGQGGCSAGPGACATVRVTVKAKPGDPIINDPAPICLGGLAHLIINPLSSGVTAVPDSITITSAALSIAVPDNTNAGANTTLVIPALPTGAQMTGIDVTLNMLHTYPGDMIFNLKAPNGNIANLYKYSTGRFTGDFGNMPNAGWINAVTSSDGNVSYSSIDSPYRYTAGTLFMPDLINNNVTGPGIQNPNGFVSSAQNMSELYSIPSGIWTLAMADGGLGNSGTLSSWQIKIKFNRPEPTPASPAIWTPAATLFVDAAGAVPYDGLTPRMDVYASAAASYSAISVLNGCYSGAANVTVAANSPISNGNASLPADNETCEYGIAAFKAVANGINPTYQWQTDNGTGNFTNITDNNNYSGTATDSLIVKNMPDAWSGYKYRCVMSITGTCNGSVTSREALLTINQRLVVTLTSSGSTSLLPGMITTLTVTSIPAAASYIWIKNGIPFNGSTNSSFDATVDGQGVYQVSITDVKGCTGISNEVAISDSASAQLFVYPSPAINGRFVVSFYSLKGNMLPRALTIYDAKGALVLKKTYNIEKPYDKMEVDCSSWGKGVYFINLAGRNGQRLAIGKVVVL